VSELIEAEARRAEEAATEEAIQRSLRDVVPAENAMPLDAALEWSRWEWEREEWEQQRWLLDLAAAQRRATAATLPCRGVLLVDGARKLLMATKLTWEQTILVRGDNQPVGNPKRKV
jgi:hypothetical protein